MEKELESYLELLNSERCLKKPKEATMILEKISRCFTQQKTPFGVGLLISLLLREESGLFAFMWKASQDTALVPGVTSAFKLLDHLLSTFKKLIEPYFPFLYQRSLSLLTGKFSKIKETSVKFIRTLIETDSKCSLDLTKIYPTFEKQIKDTSKVTVLGEIYSLLGYLFERYPESVQNGPFFFTKMCQSLKHNSDASVTVVKSAFEGLNGYLTNFPAPDVVTLGKIYEDLKSWSKFREDKKSAGRAALKLFQNHWLLFSKFVYDDRNLWKINLGVWMKNRKHERIAAYQTLCAFYKIITFHLKQHSNDSELEAHVKDFIAALDSDSNVFEKKSSLCGIKLFTLTGLLASENLLKTYGHVVNLVQKVEIRNDYYCLPECIECLSAFLSKTSHDGSQIGQLAMLRRLSVKLIDSYPKLDLEIQKDILIALEKSIYIMGSGTVELVESYIEKVVYQGLIRTCSHATSAEYELLKDQNIQGTSSRSYHGLWKHLLRLAESPNQPTVGSFALKKGMAVKVIDAFVNSFLRVIQKLNYNANSETEISDLYVFMNLVDLYVDAMDAVDPYNMEKWLVETFKTAIHLSRSNPHVCGFYKIITCCLIISERTLFFESSEDNQKCFSVVRSYIEEILIKVDQFNDELQENCLKIVLAAPSEIIKGIIEKTVPVLELAAQISRGSATLLENLMEALERWNFGLPAEDSSLILEKILPKFDMFFQSPCIRGENSSSTFNNGEFLTLQKKFLMFLGDLEVRKSSCLILLPEAEQNIRDKTLVYSFPCGYGTVEVNMEQLLLRIIDLAESCGERSTRLIACECLYSIMMVILGNVNQLSGGYTCLFRKVSKSCLFLGCDSDEIVCQIFEPLMYQMVHYFSEKRAFNFPETEDLIEILMEYVTYPFNANVREFSADLVREFTEWSIKQSTTEELKKTPESVKRILERIYSLALHPSYNKRLGAAVLFNKIYTILREESFILNAYWFELFYYFMESLRMCEGLEDVTEITKAIENVRRPLVEKSKEFNKSAPERILPPEFEGDQLCHLVKWTVERACDFNSTVRNTSMSIVQSLAPLVETCDSELRFASKQLDTFLKGGETFSSSFDESECITWLKYQLAGFSYAAWLLEEKVLTSDEVFQPDFESLMKKFIHVVLIHRSDSTTVNFLKRETVLCYFKLQKVLKDRAYSFPLEHWDLLKMAVFQPSLLGFNLREPVTMEQLKLYLVHLLSFFSLQSTSYDWEKFYRGLESVITAPVFSKITQTQNVTVEDLEFLFGLNVLEKAGLWKIFMKKVLFSMSEDVFLAPIFKSLFVHQVGKPSTAVVVEPSAKRFLSEVLTLVLKVNVNLICVMHYLENEEEAEEEETGKTVKKGEYFLRTFQKVIFTFLQSKHVLLINWTLERRTVRGVNLLIQILENSTGGGEPLAQEVFANWTEFEKQHEKRILLNLAMASAQIIGTFGCLKTSPVADMAYAMMKNFDKLDFFEMETLLNLLPFFSDFAESLHDNEKLRLALSEIEMDVDFLKKSKDGIKLSRARLASSGFLDCLKKNGSLVVLQFVLSKTTWFHSICNLEDVESALRVFEESQTSASHCIGALNLAYEFCFEKKLEVLPSVVFQWFLSPLIKIAPNSAVYYLLKENVESLHKLITTHWGEEKNTMEILTNISKKISVSRMFQMFVTKLSKDELDDLPKAKRQLIFGIVREVFFLLKLPYPSSHIKEHYRKLMCEIFNMVCCIVSARCTDQKFYKLFIFDERGGFLFETIDQTTKHSLNMDFEEIPKRKKYLTVLRKSLAGTVTGGFEKESVKYIQTNTLFTSSLAEDVTKFDLTLSAVRPSEDSWKNVEIELEMDSLNSHECMPTFVATITKMVQDNISPPGDPSQVPCWLTYFQYILKTFTFPENLKLFVLKAIYNVQEFVAPYARVILFDLVSAILNTFENSPVNYFVIDLIEMIIGWRFVPDDGDSQVKLTFLVEMVLKNSDSLRRDVAKNNLELIKTMVEVWKKGLQLPKLSSLAFDRLSCSVKQDSKPQTNFDGATYLNIQFGGILLANEIPAWKTNFEKRFLEVVLRGFCPENKHIDHFGETCGLALRLIQKLKPEILEECEELVREKIDRLSNSWLQLLYGIHKHHSKLSSHFTFKIFSSAWDSTDSFTVKKLEMLLNHVTLFPDDASFGTHACVFILDVLNSPDVAVHEVTLELAEKLLDKFDSDKLMVFTTELVHFQKSLYPGVRKRVYEICKKLYLKASDDYTAKRCKTLLLKGISDGVTELEKSCLEFWINFLDFKVPNSTFIKILKDMYTSETEDIFLSNLSRLILAHACDDERSRKQIFHHPITNVSRFRKKKFVFGLSHLTTSRKATTNQSLEQIATIGRQKLPYLRPTLHTLAFCPTVEDASEDADVLASETQNSSIPTNPPKRRFLRKSGLVKLLQRKKKNLEVEEPKKDSLDIFGEYQDGDYPDIQITHQQILTLLQVLTRADRKVAKLFLIAFYSGVVNSLKTEDGPCFLEDTAQCLENILKSSPNPNSALCGFVFQVILNHNLSVDAQLIASAAVASNCAPLGALIVEQIIARKEDEDKTVAKKRTDFEKNEDIRWIELAKLYRSLEEFDVLSGICLDKLNLTGTARNAVLYESERDWQEASNQYQIILQSETGPSLKEFFTESYLSCLAKLSNWSSLNNCIRETSNHDLDNVWNNYNLLYWFLKSEMMISLGNDKRAFQTIISDFCQNILKENILSANFGEEMAVFDWFCGNLQRANCRIDKLCSDFLAEWSHLDKWSTNRRVAKLASLQTLSELNLAVKNLMEINKLEQNVQLGLKRWQRNMPEPWDDLSLWDVKLGYRREFLSRVQLANLESVEVKFNLAFARAALAQNNLNMAKDGLVRAKSKLPKDDTDLEAEHNAVFNMGKMLLAKLRMKDVKLGLKVYLNAWNGISKQISVNASKISNYHCNFLLGQLVSEILPFFINRTVPPESLKPFCLKLKTTEESVSNVLYQTGVKYLETAVREMRDCSLETQSRTYLELCNFFLKFRDPGYFDKLCLYLLKSMSLGNEEAVELFGCLLNFHQSKEFSLADAIAASDRVPSWMFILWTNQMLASLDTHLAPLLKTILVRVTKDYPNAIRYALNLTKTETDPSVKLFLKQLRDMNSDRLYDDFISAVKFLAAPQMILKYYLENALEEATQVQPNILEMKKWISLLLDIMRSSTYSKFRGPAFEVWARFQSEIDELLLELGKVEAFSRKIRNVLRAIDAREKGSKRELRLLETYSPWLRDFHALKVNSSLELPGQYDGIGRPLKNPVKISSFKNSVLMFDSKCKPMRITVLGNDAKEHRFLIKFGEDLRQDERIQRVFRHFSQRLKQTRFYVDTYKVIPLSLNLGMIEWVENTASLFEIVENSLGDSDAIGKAQAEHLAFLSQGSPLAVPASVSGTVAAHLYAYEVISRAKSISSFRARVQGFPRDLLKKAFLGLSFCPEHFMHLRRNFGVSHAVMCLTHWLVGIGDRHLQNTLISTKTGRVLGIDFGYAFGFATQFLTPPEFLPFRLTPQMVTLMEPLEESGWMKQTMIHCLRTFRKESFRLRSVLEVFAQEPVIDWLKQAKKKPTYSAENGGAWHAREKVELVVRKLEGANPVAVFEADLRAGHGESKYLVKFLEVLRGVEQENVRARCEMDGLSEEDQVECLIDLATDPHVLAKTYVGWNAWL